MQLHWLNAGTPRYAILSHLWRDEEVLFADPNGNNTVAQAKKGRPKLLA
jgi:hypothetical protein